MASTRLVSAARSLARSRAAAGSGRAFAAGRCEGGSSGTAARAAPAAPPAATAEAPVAARQRTPRSQDAGSRGVGLSSLVLLAPCVATFGLGVWQLRKRSDKADLVELRRERLAAPPMPLAAAVAAARHSDDAGAQLEYRRILCEGELDLDRAVYVGPRTIARAFGASERGYHLVAPLESVDGAGDDTPPVMLNFGWVPLAWKDEGVPEDVKARIVSTSLAMAAEAEAEAAAARAGSIEHADRGTVATAAAAPQFRRGWRSWLGLGSGSKANDAGGAVSQQTGVNKLRTRVVAVARGSETPSGFVPPNDPSANAWWFFDAVAMAEARGLPPGTPLLDVLRSDTPDSGSGALALSVLDPRAIPAARAPPLSKAAGEFLKFPTMPDGHLQYSLTWFALSAATSIMAYQRLRQHILPKAPRARNRA